MARNRYVRDGKRWIDEFTAEIVSDHRELLDCRRNRSASGAWSFEVALERTRAFYRERFIGFARCDSIDQDELEALLRMVESLGTPDFPT
jgi:hypothetical protein